MACSSSASPSTASSSAGHCAKPLLLLWSAVFLLMIILPLGRMGVLPNVPLLNELSIYLPAISFFMFGILSAMQLEQVRIDLLGSQQQAIGNLQRYQALFNNAAEGIVRCTRESAILEANPSFMRLLGRTTRQASLVGLPIQSLLKAADWNHLLLQLSDSHRPSAANVRSTITTAMPSGCTCRCTCWPTRTASKPSSSTSASGMPIRSTCKPWPATTHSPACSTAAS